jgi:hypothetical protein
MVIISGKYVIPAMNPSPSQDFPTPDRVAIISPYLKSFDPLKTINAEQLIKPITDK